MPHDVETQCGLSFASPLDGREPAVVITARLLDRQER